MYGDLLKFRYTNKKIRWIKPRDMKKVATFIVLF
jgi:hypothetical protein